jgi:hypothetical protein
MEREGCIIKTLPLDPILRHKNPAQTPTPVSTHSHLGLESLSGLLRSSFLTKILYAFLSLPIRYTAQTDQI